MLTIIKINHKLLSDAPYQPGTPSIIDFDRYEHIRHVSNDLIKGCPLCVLVSGYRGAGKTSFSRKIVENCIQSNNASETFVFIELKVPNYKDYKNLLRKIIRGLYLAISDNREVWGQIKDVKQDTSDERTLGEHLSLLYERTFRDVATTNKTEEKGDTNHQRTTEIDVKSFLVKSGTLFLLVVAPGVAVSATTLLKLPAMPSVSLVGVACIVAGLLFIRNLKSLDIKLTRSDQTTSTKDVTAKDLYDDDIADYHLDRFLKQLSSIPNRNIKPVFIFDEIDKIDTVDQTEKLISDLKPWMLSGLASFFVVSGQQLLYKYESSRVEDDAIIGSIFSRVVHVPLLSRSDFHSIAKRLVVQEHEAAKPDFKKFVDSAILNSGMTPRKFLNIFRSSLVWKDDGAYIEIDEARLHSAEKDQRYLESIETIIREEIAGADDTDGLRDLFTASLFQWCYKIRQKTSPFQSAEIFSIPTSESAKPSYRDLRLLYFIEKLVAQLVVDNLLSINLVEASEGDSFFYENIYAPRLESLEKTSIDLPARQQDFIDGFTRLETVANIICDEIRNRYPQVKQAKSSLLLLDAVSQIYQDWSSKHKIRELVQTKDAILRGDLSESKALSANVRSRFVHLISSLSETRIYEVLKKHLDGSPYEIDREAPFLKEKKVRHHDLVIRKKSDPSIKFIVEIKNTLYNQSVKAGDLYKFLNEISELHSTDTGKPYGILLWTTFERNQNLNSINSEFKTIISTEYPRLIEYISFPSTTLDRDDIVRKVQGSIEFFELSRPTVLEMERNRAISDIADEDEGEISA